METNDSFHNSLYRIGCPVWSCPHWKGSVYSHRAPKDRWLRQYSQIFGAVEGNSTFYGIPRIETFERWAEQTVPGFRFCLKFPRIISHEKELMHVEHELGLFLQGVEVLARGERLGPTFLQLGPSFGPSKFDRLAFFLKSLPTEYDFAVEVRHLDWFREPAESKLNELLIQLAMERVIFDSRPLFSELPEDEIERASQSRKPKSPVNKIVTGNQPMLRLVGRNKVSKTAPWVEEWVPIIAQWIREGRHPIVFTHAPDDRYAPQFSFEFHNRLSIELDEIFAVEEFPHTAAVQGELF
ncbi:MAG: DUF72 domain-containing protein [Planctomycetota bacterium]